MSFPTKSGMFKTKFGRFSRTSLRPPPNLVMNIPNLVFVIIHVKFQIDFKCTFSTNAGLYRCPLDGTCDSASFACFPKAFRSEIDLPDLVEKLLPSLVCSTPSLVGRHPTDSELIELPVANHRVIVCSL